VLSDVPGDDLAVVGSGPTVPDRTTFADALAVVRRYGLETRLPVRYDTISCAVPRRSQGVVPRFAGVESPPVARVIAPLGRRRTP